MVNLNVFNHKHARCFPLRWSCTFKISIYIYIYTWKYNSLLYKESISHRQTLLKHIVQNKERKNSKKSLYLFYLNLI